MASQDLRNRKQSPDEAQSGCTEGQQVQREAEEAATNPNHNSKVEQCPDSTNPRLQNLLSKQLKAQETLTQLRTQRSTLVAQSQSTISPDLSPEAQTQQALSDANATTKNHIASLTKYNEIKDIAQGLMGLIAEQRGVRVGVVMEEFGMGEGD